MNRISLNYRKSRKRMLARCFFSLSFVCLPVVFFNEMNAVAQSAADVADSAPENVAANDADPNGSDNAPKSQPTQSTTTPEPPKAPTDPQVPAANDAASSDSTTPTTGSPPPPTTDTDSENVDGQAEYVPPWDFSPYKVLVWVISNDPTVNAETLNVPLRTYFDREYSAIWRVSIEDAPDSVSAAAWRDINDLSFDAIAASDPVVAVKKDHKDAIRIRIASNVAEYVKRIPGTTGLIEEVVRRAEINGKPYVDGLKDKFEVVDTDLIGIADRWNDAATEALLLPRGMALNFEKPSAKIVKLPLANLVASAIDNYDKIFFLRIDSVSSRPSVSVVECETLMRYFGRPLTEEFASSRDLPIVAGHAVTEAFSPVVRIEEAGTSSANGLIRASGLIQNPESSALVRLGDLLMPMIRKNDRNGKPIMIGALDWAYLYTVSPPVALNDWVKLAASGETKGEVLSNDTDVDPGDQVDVAMVNGQRARVGRSYDVKIDPADENAIGTVVFTDLEKGKFTFTPGDGFPGQVTFEYAAADKYGNMDKANVQIGGEKPKPEVAPPAKPIQRTIKMMYYSGRAGGLQGRRNSRTFRIALRVKPRGDHTLLRLHAKGEPDFPLIGYEIYQKELTSKSMEFVGRTDWNGRLLISKTDDPLRLMYVKNGGAVLARLPMVPGLTRKEVADLSGDDMRLQAEAYIRGVQNAIVDLVAIRRLLAARVKLRLQRGQYKEAEELVILLREQPSAERLSNDMTAKLPEFLKAIGNRDANQKRKVDNMFTMTREMLAKQLSSRDVRDVEDMLQRAKANGGTLPPEEESEDEQYDASANVVAADDG